MRDQPEVERSCQRQSEHGLLDWALLCAVGLCRTLGCRAASLGEACPRLACRTSRVTRAVWPLYWHAVLEVGGSRSDRQRKRARFIVCTYAGEASQRNSHAEGKEEKEKHVCSSAAGVKDETRKHCVGAREPRLLCGSGQVHRRRAYVIMPGVVGGGSHRPTNELLKPGPSRQLEIPDSSTREGGESAAAGCATESCYKNR